MAFSPGNIEREDLAPSQVKAPQLQERGIRLIHLQVDPWGCMQASPADADWQNVTGKEVPDELQCITGAAAAIR